MTVSEEEREMEAAEWGKSMTPFAALDTALDGILKKIDDLSPELPQTPEAAELAIWETHLEVAELEEKLYNAKIRLKDLRDNYAKIRIKQLKESQPEKVAEEPTTSKP